MQKNVGDKIRMAREKVNVSQKKLGMTLGLSDKAISAYESGRTLPPLDTLNKIAIELKKPLSYFISNAEDENALVDRVDSVERILKDLLIEVQEIRNVIKK